MNKTLLNVLGVVCLSLCLPMFASARNNNIEASIQKTTEQLRDAEGKLLLEAKEVDGSLAAKGVKANTDEQVKLIFKNMEKDLFAWNRMESRDTKRHEEGKDKLKAYVSEAKNVISKGNEQLRAIRAAEYAEWARANPEAAALRALESRISSAEFAAREADRRARDAEDGASAARVVAESAKREAAQAQSDSYEAKKRAQNAERKLRDAESQAQQIEIEAHQDKYINSRRY